MRDIAWTFGLITVYEDKERLQEIVESIRALAIPEYEILLVGGGDSSDGDGFGGDACCCCGLSE